MNFSVIRVWSFMLFLSLIFLSNSLFSQGGTVIHVIPCSQYPGGLTWDGQHLWLGSTSSGQLRTIDKIDPVTGAVLKSIPEPRPEAAAEIRGLAWDGDYLWVYRERFGSSTPDRWDYIYRMDTTGVVLDSIRSPFEDYTGGMAWGDSSLWLSQYNPPNVIHRVNPNTGAIEQTINAVGEQPMGVAWDGQFVWAAEDTGFGATRQEIYQYDPTTGSYTGTYLRNPDNSPRDMAWDGQYLWLVGYNTQQIYQIDVGGGGTPAIGVPTTQVNFPLTEIGQTNTFQAGILNTGTATLSVDSIVFTNPVFSTDVASFPILISEGSQAIVGFTFTPVQFGTETGLAHIHSNDPVTPVVTVNLKGRGMYSDPTIVATATSHDFGNVWIPEEGLANWTVGLINQGIQTLQITDLALADPAFHVESPSAPFNIAPDDTTEITVYFNPQQAVLYQDTLKISNNDPATPVLDIALQGTGQGGPFDLGYEFWNYQVPDNPSTTFNEYRPLALKAVGDVTGDGYADVVLATRNYWTICLNGFSSGFASEVWRFSSYISSFSAGGIGNTNDLPPQQRALAIHNDMNNDGVPDVVIGTGGGNEHVYALDGSNGSILWQFGTDHPDSFSLGDITSVNVDEDFNGDGINDVIASGSATSPDGSTGRRSVYCFDATNGQILWQKFLGAFIRMSIPVGDLNGNGSLDVIAGTGEGVQNAYAIVAFDGNAPNNPIWSFPVGVNNGGGRELIRYPVDGETDDVIAGAYYSPVYRLDGETGVAVWTRSFGSLGFIHEFSLLNDINGDGLKEVLVANATSSFHCLDGATGNTLWSVPLGNYSWSVSAIPDITGDHKEDVVVASRNDNLYVFDGTDGTILHTRPMNSGMLQGATLASIMPDMDNNNSWEILGADDSGKIISLSGGPNAPTAIDDKDQPVIPDRFRLSQNYPNPFNPSTTIEIHLPNQSDVSLKIYNILGQQIRAYDFARVQPGVLEVVWDGKDASGSQVPSGVYFYTVQTEQQRVTKKMILMR